MQLLVYQLLNQLLRFHHLILQSIHVFEQIALGKQLVQQELCIGLILIQHVLDQVNIVDYLLFLLLDLPGLGSEKLGRVLLLSKQLLQELGDFPLLGRELVSNLLLDGLELLLQSRPLFLQDLMKGLLHVCLTLDFVGLYFVDLDLLELFDGQVLQFEDFLVSVFSVLAKQDTVRADHFPVGETNQVGIFVVLQTKVNSDEISDSHRVFLARVVFGDLLLDCFLKLLLFSKLD